MIAVGLFKLKGLLKRSIVLIGVFGACMVIASEGLARGGAAIC